MFLKRSALLQCTSRFYASHGMKRRLSVLVCDDNQDTVDCLSLLLECTGCSVNVARSGVEAHSAAGLIRPDVALLDIGLPDINGCDVAKAIRSQPWARNTVLIAISGHAAPVDRRKALDAGFNHYLTKPVDPIELERLLSSVYEAGDPAHKTPRP